MGLILDIVSNHMAVGGSDNPWWLDLLEWGRLSPYGEFFDIQWHSPDPLMEGQLLLPFLGSDYGVGLAGRHVPCASMRSTVQLLCRALRASFPDLPDGIMANCSRRIRGAAQITGRPLQHPELSDRRPQPGDSAEGRTARTGQRPVIQQAIENN
jgi:maltooligosyltrehalose synthase